MSGRSRGFVPLLAVALMASTGCGRVGYDPLGGAPDGAPLRPDGAVSPDAMVEADASIDGGVSGCFVEPERCGNAIDDDCNGAVDDGCPCQELEVPATMALGDRPAFARAQFGYVYCSEVRGQLDVHTLDGAVGGSISIGDDGTRCMEVGVDPGGAVAITEHLDTMVPAMVRIGPDGSAAAPVPLAVEPSDARNSHRLRWFGDRYVWVYADTGSVVVRTLVPASGETETIARIEGVGASDVSIDVGQSLLAIVVHGDPESSVFLVVAFGHRCRM